MKKYFLDFSIFILIFLFSIFALTNLGFIFHIGVNLSYIILSFIFACVFLYKSGNFYKKFIFLSLIFFISFICANLFIDTSFDGRCYHFTIENLLKLGYNPIYDDIQKFGAENNIFYNLIFANSYPNAIEAIRANFYLAFGNMESSKITNFLFMFSSFFYVFHFFLLKMHKLSKEQKQIWLEKFFRRMKNALYKWYIVPPGPITDAHSINKSEYKQPIISNINYKEKFK